MAKQSCPVCTNGVVPAAFYGDMDDRMVTCRTCGGSQEIDRPTEAGPSEAGGADPRYLNGQ